MDNVTLQRLLDTTESGKITLLAAKSVASALREDIGDLRVGPRVSLGGKTDSFHLLDASTILWPPQLYVKAEFSDPTHETGSGESEEIALSQALNTLDRYIESAEQAQELLPLARRAQGGFLNRLGSSLGFGPSMDQARNAASSLEALCSDPAFLDAEARTRTIIDRAEQAHRAQANGVALFEGVHGTPSKYIHAAREYVKEGLNLQHATIDSLDRKYVAPALVLVSDILKNPYSTEALAAEARKILHAITVKQSRALLSEMPLEKLKEVTSERLRFQGLDTVGVNSVGDVLTTPLAVLMQVPGIGEQTAQRIKAAAQTLYSESTAQPVRSIGDKRTDDAVALLEVLVTYSQAHTLSDDQAQRRERLISYFREFPASVASHGAPFLVFKVGDRSFDQFIEDIAWAQATPETFMPKSENVHHIDAWTDYLERPAHYQSLLSSLLSSMGSGVGDDHGLSEDTLTAIRSLQLKTDKLKDLHLRGYQSFGAKFSLVQQKVLLGDEMGLGKTVQALAAAAHVAQDYNRESFSAHVREIANQDATRPAHEDSETDLDKSRSLNEFDYSFSANTDDMSIKPDQPIFVPDEAPIVVVVPASLIVNWRREIEKFTTLNVFVAHGPQREDMVAMWKQSGGVLVLTYAGARSTVLPPAELVIVDEAHMVKNPQALRSQAVASMVRCARRAVLMTGTPLENRATEFAQLIEYLQPDLLDLDQRLSPSDFRAAVAPAYLRRNQEDVLDELPEKVEHDEWVELSAEDQKLYSQAIESKNWMAARRAAMQSPTPLCAKVERIREIVNEATDDGRNVLIFSYFRDVLDRLHEEFSGQCVGIINGDVPPVQRQQLVDDLGSRGNVLIAQIGAGGVGLNIQKASVVILAEVQIKPTIEEQAIARAHRLGQLSVVNVYRIIGDDTVDERLLEIVGAKRKIFDSFARESHSADVPDAVDVSEAALAQQIIAAERKRLGMEDEAPQSGQEPEA